MVRKMIWRNERGLRVRKCDLCKKETISMYLEGTKFPVYCRDCWWSDAWSPLDYEGSYDFSKTFFAQFRELRDRVPRPALSYTNVVDSKYLNYAIDAKNAYLVFGCHDVENVAYGKIATYVKDSMDVAFTDRSELCYDVINCTKSFKVSFSKYADDCQDSMFLLDCRNCSNCMGCVSLRNKSYCIFNEQYSKEEYKKRLAELDLGSFKNLAKLNLEFQKYSMLFPRRFANIRNSVNVIGDDINHSRNCYTCFYLTEGSENCRYSVVLSDPVKDSSDLVNCAFSGTELLYEMISGAGRRLFFGHKVWYGYEIIFSEECHSSNNLFACIGLRNKSYCILNKQYTKEEYEKLVPRIIEHMNQMPYTDKKGRIYKYGEFFPPELSPFSYNETIAQEYFPLTKEQAIEKGYSWKDPEPRNYQITLKSEDIPDHINDITDGILNQIIQCAHAPLGGETAKCNEQCTQAFRIIPQELEFLRKMNLPLPRLCPNCRHYQRIKQRNPLKLWHRRCQCAGAKSENGIYQNTADHMHHKKDEPCLNEFETTYAPERPEIVYCEACYLREVV